MEIRKTDLYNHEGWHNQCCCSAWICYWKTGEEAGSPGIGTTRLQSLEFHLINPLYDLLTIEFPDQARRGQV